MATKKTRRIQMMVLGGVLAISDRRYRLRLQQRQASIVEDRPLAAES